LRSTPGHDGIDAIECVAIESQITGAEQIIDLFFGAGPDERRGDRGMLDVPRQARDA
jgi:hypothetical protein